MANQPNRYIRLSQEEDERLRELEADGQALGQLALRFVLDHPAVSVAIPGAKSPEQVEANVAASVRPLLSEEARRHIDDVAPMGDG
jgi:aryl-alcohol dehydrogenase-like predicted oxidoreductase